MAEQAVAEQAFCVFAVCLSPADWIAIVVAAISALSAAFALNQASSARRQADAAEGALTTARQQVDLAKRQADAAEAAAKAAQLQADAANRQLELATAAIQVDYIPVLSQGGDEANGTWKYPFVEIEWKGPEVRLESLVATKWGAFDTDFKPIEGTISTREVPLRSANKALPITIRSGEKVLFLWPGPGPGPNFSGTVRLEYSLGGYKASSEREVQVHGYSGFRYGGVRS